MTAAETIQSAKRDLSKRVREAVADYERTTGFRVTAVNVRISSLRKGGVLSETVFLGAEVTTDADDPLR